MKQRDPHVAQPALQPTAGRVVRFVREHPTNYCDGNDKRTTHEWRPPLSGNSETRLPVGVAYAPPMSDAEHVAVDTGDVPPRLLCVFATDSFADVEYRFPGKETSL